MKNGFQILVMYQYLFLVLRYTMVMQDATQRKKGVGVYVNRIFANFLQISDYTKVKRFFIKIIAK